MQMLLALILTLIISGSCLAEDYFETDEVITTTHELKESCDEYNDEYSDEYDFDEALYACKECWISSKEDSGSLCSLCYGYLIKHVENCTPCILKQYIADGMSPDLEIPNYGSIFITQAKQENYPCLKYLINENADVDALDSSGSSALFYCSMKGFSDCTSLLIKSGADVNLQNDKGSTALMFAASYGHPENVQILINNNASIYSVTNLGYTAMNYAAINGRWECVDILYSEGGQCCSAFNVLLLLRSAYDNIPMCCSTYYRFYISHTLPFLGLSAYALFYVAKLWSLRKVDDKYSQPTIEKKPQKNNGNNLLYLKGGSSKVFHWDRSLSPQLTPLLKRKVVDNKQDAEEKLSEPESRPDSSLEATVSINTRFIGRIRECINKRCSNQQIVQELIAFSEEFSGSESILTSLKQNEINRLRDILTEAGVNRFNCGMKKLSLFKGILNKLKRMR